MRRVVVTGLGLVTSLGDGVKETWGPLINSVSGIKIIKHFDTSDLACKIGGFVNQQNQENVGISQERRIGSQNHKESNNFKIG